MTITRAASGSRLALLAALAVGLAAPALVISAPASAATPQPTLLCPPRPGHFSCLAERMPASIPAAPLAGMTPAAITPATFTGYTPADLRSAYRIPSSSTAATVAVVDAFDAPNVESDLAKYRSYFGMAPCTTANGCFNKVNQSGAASPLPMPNSDWAGEITLDVEMVSAVCPSCHILLVEAADDDATGQPNMEIAVKTAAKDAKYVSMSWGGQESSQDAQDDSFTFGTTSKVVYVAAAGDNDFGTSWPAANPKVVSVGGTSLVHSTNSRGWNDTAWGFSDGSGTGGGCASNEARPSWQGSSEISSVCGSRAMNDVSMVADPHTGVSVFENGAWSVFGGTSASTPMVASMYALAGNVSSVPAPAYPYSHRNSFYDVTSGANAICSTRICNATTGWDGPTGVGVPLGINGLSAALNIVVVHNPGTVTSYAGRGLAINTKASDSGHAAVRYTASGLPKGASMRSDGFIVGTPTRAGAYNITVRATDGLGSTGSTTFRLNVVLHHIVTTQRPHVAGTVRHGHTVSVSFGTFRQDSVHGAVIHPHYHVQWYLSGKAIRGATGTKVKIPSSWRGRSLKYRVTASSTYYHAYQHTTTSVRVR
jgi:hypothetical protein